MTGQFKAIAAGLLLLAALASGWFIRSWYDDSREAAVLRAQQETRDKMTELAGDVATSTEVALAKIRITNRNIYHATEKEIRTEPVYRDCLLPDPGRVLANQARGATGPSTGKPDGAMRTDAAP